MVKITVDTNQDSKEDIMHTIALLERYVQAERSYIEQKKESEPSGDALAGFANMMNSTPELKEESEEEEIPQVVEY